jgi:predicted dehydrogenase
MQTSRRSFVKSAVGTGVALSSGPFVGRVLGANERPVAGVIGCGGQGRWNLRDFQKTGQVEIAAVCDVYDANMAQLAELSDGKPAQYKDYRRILERKDIDFVIISTPDHWHALPMIEACDAGKDVYVEKPLSLTVVEGRRMVEAARRNRRVVQAGTQQRSGRHFQEAVEIVRSGRIGVVSSVRTWNYANQYPLGIGNPPDTAPLPGLDWDLWLGPAPKLPYNRNRCLYNFRWFWDYSGGMMTDWGTHLVDVVHWAMGVDAPTSVYAAGGKLQLRDNRETPDTLEVVYEYPGFVLNYSYRILNGRGVDGHGYGIQFHGSEGTLFVDRGGYELFPEPARDESLPPPIAAAKAGGSPQHYPHVVDFLECLKSRKPPNSDVEICHRSTSACHLANISYKTKRRIAWDGKTEQITSDPEAAQLLQKEYRSPWKLA